MLVIILLLANCLGVLSLLVANKHNRELDSGRFNILNRKVGFLMTTVAELPGLLDAIGAKIDVGAAAISSKLNEATTEIRAEIQSLKDVLSQGGTLTTEAEQALDRLTSKVDEKFNAIQDAANTLADISPAVGAVEVPAE